MSTTTTSLYLLDRARKSTTQTAAGPADKPVPLDLAWFDAFLERFHNPGGSYSSQFAPANSHAEQFAIYRDIYVDQQSGFPARDGIMYYDPAANAMHAYYYLQARGNPPDQRWLDYADDCGTVWHTAIQRGDYTTFTGVYRFPHGLWLCQDAGIALTPAEFTDDCLKAVRVYGSYYYGGVGVGEQVARETGRLMEWLCHLYRMVGQDDPLYQRSDGHYGSRYHTGAPWEEHHLWEWSSEWIEDPLYDPPLVYPERGMYTDSVDYAARGVDPSRTLSNALYSHGPFMAQFKYQSNMQLWNEDANYQTPQRVDEMRKIVDTNHQFGWWPPTGTPGAAAQYGAWGYYYCLCGPEGQERVITQECLERAGASDYWGHRHWPSIELSGFHLEALGWMWRQTGDNKYVLWFDETWNGLRQKFNDGAFNQFFRSYALGKQANQLALRIFHGLVLRGDLEFKTAMYPTGWPYPTPPAVDPG